MDNINPLKIAVLISGHGSNLQALINTQEQLKSYKIQKVISNNPEAYGVERAKLAHIETAVIPHANYPSTDAFERVLINAISDPHEPDFILLAGFMRLLSPAFIQHYPHKIINIHPSLLPHYAGLNTHQRVLEAKETWHGTTVHLVDEGLDTGPILAQAKLPVLANDTPETLKYRVLKLEHQLYPRIIDQIAKGHLKLPV